MLATQPHSSTGEGRVEQKGRSRTEQLGRTAAVNIGQPPGGFEKPCRSGHFPMEVAGVQLLPPHRLIHRAQLSDRELRWAERRCKRGVLEFGAGPRDCVPQDFRVVEREAMPDSVDDRHPGRAGRIAAGHRLVQIRSEGQPRDRDRAHPRVAVRRPVGRQLFEVDTGDDPGLLAQFPVCRITHVLIHVDEAARERPPAGIRVLPAFDEQNREVTCADGENDEVDCHGERRIPHAASIPLCRRLDDKAGRGYRHDDEKERSAIMAAITHYPLVRHLRSTPTTYVRHLVNGAPRHTGVGEAFWFRPLTSAISEVPIDDREHTALVEIRTADLHHVAVPVTVVYRVADPGVTVTRVDCSVDVRSGAWEQAPLEALGSAIHAATAEAVATALAGQELMPVLTADLGHLGATILRVLGNQPSLGALGLQAVTVRVGLPRPEPDVERALQTPAREAIQQEADKATFERRALAVEREAAIGENELSNEIELARRREQLIAQQGANSRRQAEQEAEAAAVATESDATRQRTLAAARAEADRVIGQAAADNEQARIAAYANVPRELLLALAVREAAEHLPAIDHLVVTPDLVQGLLAKLTSENAA